MSFKEEKFTSDVAIQRYPFDRSGRESMCDDNFVMHYWPVVYLLYSDVAKQIYIGETTNAAQRIGNHLNNRERQTLKWLFLITCKSFNKSATLDLESQLIKYFGADGNLEVQNANLGIQNHEYFMRGNYNAIFNKIWTELRRKRIAISPLQKLDNSDLFKYSPYKSLSTDQHTAVQAILITILRQKQQAIFVQGRAGTGKTVLATFLAKLLKTEISDLKDEANEQTEDDYIELLIKLRRLYPDPKIALVVPMTSLRKTLKTVFKHVKGLKSDMVISPTQVAKRKYDILLVDEAHRLRRRRNITNYKSFDDVNRILGFADGTELDWLKKQSKKLILFYDAQQSIKPSDVRAEDFKKIKKRGNTIILQSQWRVKGGKDYISFIERLLSGTLKKGQLFKSHLYDLLLFRDIKDFAKAVSSQEEQVGLSRMVAGYSWEWVSKKNKKATDITIQGMKLKWNSANIDWINSTNAGKEVGCIHTTQGYDLNYTGVIFGREISYDFNRKKILVNSDFYFDRNGKAGISDPNELHDYIINIYETLMFRGIRGTFVYACNDSLRRYFEQHIPVYRTTNKKRT